MRVRQAHDGRFQELGMGGRELSRRGRVKLIPGHTALRLGDEITVSDLRGERHLRVTLFIDGAEEAEEPLPAKQRNTVGV
ncbi:hypothetical protein A7A08_01671 [Methyloligella halotolerans]|uniref:Uncharacterized protein n=1 Tax=Methyloligella halotolerans TaxID=1177755 RepID=A0A1E2RZH8_9HYPH|nr:hypothetical protein A7A08_01671 [Methyloligella halotolerans]